MMFNADQPIQRAKEDILGRTDFAKSLAKVILSNESKECLTLGLYGSWGSGKTSLLNLIDEEIQLESKKLDEKQKPIIMRFNPWIVSNQEQLLHQFFLELSNTLKINAFKDIKNELADLIEKYSSVFNVASLMPQIGLWGQILTGIIASTVFKFLKHDKKDYALSAVKNKLYKKLSEINFKIIIMIDDIDRLNNEEIRQIFQLVKVIADFPNCIYMLSFDRNIVVKALQDINNDNGLNYLEKIVQIPFEIPEVNKSNINKLLFSKLNEIIGELNEDEFDREHWSRVFQNGISNWINNIRDVTRVINTFSLKYSLIKNESNFIDLLAIVTLEIFEPNVYEKIKVSKDLLTGPEMFTGGDENEKEKEQIKEIINLSSRGKEVAVKSILSELFPKVSKIMDSWTLYSYDERRSRKYSMIRNAECFDIYFKLTLSERNVSKTLVRDILYNMEEGEVVSNILKINDEGKITSFLDITRAFLHDLKDSDKINQRIPLLLKSLYMNWNSLNDDNEESFFSLPFIWRLLDVTEDLLSVMSDVDSRYSEVHVIITNKKIPLRLRVSLLLAFERKYNRFTDKDYRHLKKLLELDHVMNLENEIYTEISTRAAANENDFELLDVMYFWRHKNEEEMNEFIKKTISNDDGLVNFISRFVVIGKVAKEFVYQIFIFHKVEFEKYCDIQYAYKCVKRMLNRGYAKKFKTEELKKLIAFSISVERQDYDGIKVEDVEKECRSYINKWQTNKLEKSTVE